MKRRHMMVSAAALALAASLPFTSGSAQAQSAAPVHVLGKADAPVEIIEFSSLTCPHCASFHNNTLPEVKKNWIDTGKAKIVYRHYPLDRLALAGAIAANCLPSQTAFFPYMDILFAKQQDWARASDPIAELAKLGSIAGLTPERLDTCLQDNTAIDALLSNVQDASTTYQIQSTPTFIINQDVRVAGTRSYEDFNEVLEKAYEETQ